MRRCLFYSIILGGLFLFLDQGFTQEMVTDPWTIPVTVSCSGITNDLNFGTKSGASDGYDSGKDVMAPPAPPSGLYAYLQISGFPNKLTSDFRSNTKSPNSWTLKITQTEGAGGSISWNSSGFPSGDIPGTLTIGGTNMLTQSSKSFTGDNTFTISYTAPQNNEDIPITVTTDPAGLDIIVDASTYTSPQTFDWEEGSSHDVEAPSPQSGGTGTRYVYTSWSDGGGQSHSYTVPSSSETITANYNTQYYLTTSENPGAGGDITPTPPGKWCDSGDVESVNASVAGGYQWAGWSGSLSGTTKPETITMNSSKSVTANFAKEVEITVTTDPAGREFSVDGTPYTSAQTFNWVEGETYELSVSSPQSGGTGIRYVYTSWSDGGSSSHTYTVPGSNETVTANFKTQYRLTVNSDYGSPTGENWYDAGQDATFGVTTPASGGEGTRYVFTSWTGSGTGSYSGSEASYTVTMNNPITETASWNTQYYLTVNSAHGTTTGEGWYNDGTSAGFSVSPTTVSGGSGKQYVFTGWDGSGSGSYDGTNASHSVTMNNPITENANWKTQYYLNTHEDPDVGGDITPSPPGGWYDSGTGVSVNATPSGVYQWVGWSGDLSGTARPKTITMNSSKSVTAKFGREVQITITTDPEGRRFKVDGTTYNSTKIFDWLEKQTHNLSLSATQGGGTGIQYVYTSWSDGGSKNHTYTVPGYDETVTANFKTQYQLTVYSAHGTVSGTDWYDSGESTMFSVSPATVPGEDGTRYIFTGWSGTGTGSYNGNNSSHTVTMYNPITEDANWKTQYELKVNTDHGTGSGAGWYDTGTSATFSVAPTIVSGGTGTKYIFTDWTGAGNGSYTGIDSIHTVTMNNSITEDAGWETHYYLTTSENPDAGGDMTPEPPGGWYEAGTEVILNASPNTSENYVFGGWSGDVTGTDSSAAIIMNSPKSATANFTILGQKRVTTNPEGLTIIVDGTEYTSPQDFYWASGSVHTIGVDSSQDGGSGIQYVYESWSDGGEKTHDIVINGIGVYTANFVTQYYLSTAENPDEGGDMIPAPPGAWYDAGTVVTLSADPDTDYVFGGWSGDISGTDSSTTVTMDNTKSVTANFTILGKVIITTDPEGLTINVDDLDYISPQEFDWIPGSEHTIGVLSSQSGGEGIQYIFQSWNDGGEQTHDIVIDGITLYTANFVTQYFLSTSEYPDAGGDMIPSPPGEWYDAGSVVSLKAAPAVNYYFEGWSGDASGTDSSTTILMDSLKSVTANFNKKETGAPYITECLPPGGACEIPRNVDIQFKVKDDEYGVDLNTLNVFVNGTVIVSGGVDQTSGKVVIKFNSPSCELCYDPNSDYKEGENVSVRVQCQDLAYPCNTLDSTYSFFIGQSPVIFMESQEIDQSGGVVTDSFTGIEITIPEGAVDDTVNVTIGIIKYPPAMPDSVEGIGLNYHFGPDGLKFKDSVTVRIPYSQVDLSTSGVNDPMDLPVYYFSTTKGKWIKLKVFSTDADYIYVKVNEFCYLNFGKENFSSGISEKVFDTIMPTEYELMQNYPNPFNPETVIRYKIPEASHVSLEVFNTVGQRIRILVDEFCSAGVYDVIWDGRDDDGKLAGSGMYLYVLRSGDYSNMLKAVFMK